MTYKHYFYYVRWCRILACQTLATTGSSAPPTTSTTSPAGRAQSDCWGMGERARHPPASPLPVTPVCCVPRAGKEGGAVGLVLAAWWGTGFDAIWTTVLPSTLASSMES